eukprot:g39917.t1
MICDVQAVMSNHLVRVHFWKIRATCTSKFEGGRQKVSFGCLPHRKMIPELEECDSSSDWSTTFGLYLSTFLDTEGCPGYSTEVVLLPQEHDNVLSRVASSVANPASPDALDLVFLDTSLVSHVVHDVEGAKVVATARRILSGTTQQVGAVLVRRNDVNTGLLTWDDLSTTTSSLTLCAYVSIERQQVSELSPFLRFVFSGRFAVIFLRLWGIL